MDTIKVLDTKILKIPFEITGRQQIINSVENATKLLQYKKNESRTILIPNFPDDLDGVTNLPQGLVKVGKTPQGTLFTTSPGPGIQISSDIFYDSPTRIFFESIFNKVKSLHSIKETIETFYQYSWFFINKPETTEAAFHEHTKFHVDFPYDRSNYTWTYYLQLPDNCIGDEGKLEFSRSLQGTNSYKLFPELNTLYIFPADLYHRPNLSPNSTVDRITAAGNILIPKSEKSLFNE